MHIVPNDKEEEIQKTFNEIKEMITKEAETLSEDVPEHKELAYEVRHDVRQADGSYPRYNEAYFGSVKIKAGQPYVESLRKSLEDRDDILRFLLLETVAEDTRIGEPLPGSEPEEEPEEEKKKKSTTEEGKESNSEEKTEKGGKEG